MLSRLKSILRSWGRWEQAFLLALLLYLPASFVAPEGGFTSTLNLVVWFFGIAVIYRLLRRGLRRSLWRLRNRLLIAYTFIAVVPIVLILALATITAWLITGQLAIYLVNSRIEDRVQSLDAPVSGLLDSPLDQRANRLEWIGPYLEQLFPDVRILLTDESGDQVYPEGAAIAHPPPQWEDVSGVMWRDGWYYLWSHHQSSSGQVTALAPVTAGYLANLVPGLGGVEFFRGSDGIPSREGEIRNQRGAAKDPDLTLSLSGTDSSESGLSPVRTAAQPPPKTNFLDLLVFNGTVLPAAIWDQPGIRESHVMGIRTRLSALLRIAYSQKAEVASFVLAMLAILSALFLLVEFVSLVFGISFTRTITRSVHNLYKGTQRMQAGEFSHRVPVKGKDQLAELTVSFNQMTEDIQRLLTIEKEQQRLTSDLEIARKVQTDLFPKEIPRMAGLELEAQVSAANLVSGDFYDFLKIEDHGLAVVFGDVAGKGISAALLMAAIQSAMRVQILVHAESNGSGCPGFSPAAMVSRLNQQLYNHTSAEKFSTFFFGVYEESNSRLVYTNAGHLPPVLLRNGETIRLDVNGMVVGAFPFAEFGQSSITLDSGDLLICFTDGVTEPENEYGEMFGEERLLEVLHRSVNLPLARLFAPSPAPCWNGPGRPGSRTT